MLTYLTISLFCALLFVLTLFFDFDHGDVSHHDDGYVSLRAALLFGAGFGAGGTLAMQVFGLPAFPASGGGILLGLIAAGVGVKTTKMFLAQESDSTVSLRAIVGRTAHVTVAITPHTTGQIVVSDAHGNVHHVTARSAHAQDFGTEVYVDALIGSDAYVSSAQHP